MAKQTCQEPTNAFSRLVIAGEIKGVAVPNPARQWLESLVLQAHRHIEEAWGTRTTVEVLIPAAHSKVHIVPVECHGKYPSTVGQIPDGQCTCGMEQCFG